MKYLMWRTDIRTDIHTDGLTYIVRCIHDGPPSVKTESGNYLVGVEII